MHNKDALKLNTNKNILVFVTLASFFIIPFLYSSRLIDPVLTIGFLGLSVLSLVSLLILLFFNIKKIIFIDPGFLKNGLIISFLVFIIISGFSISNALNKREAFVEFIKIVQYFIFFILLLIVFNKAEFKNLFCKSVISFSIIILALGAFQLYPLIVKGTFDHHATYLIKATFAHRNLYCEMLLLCFPFCIYGLYIYRKAWRYISVVSSSLILIYITILLSRTAWLALVAGSFCTIIVFLIFYQKFVSNRGSFKRILIYLTLVIIILFSGVFLYSRLDKLSTFKRQIEGFANHTYGSSQERLLLWEKSIKITKHHYLLGVGLGNWKIIMPSSSVENMRSENGELIFQRPHNDIIWVFSESGILGLIPYTLLFLISLYVIIKTLKNSASRSESVFVLMLFYCLVIFSVISCFSFPKERITHSMFILFVLTMIVILTKKRSGKSFNYKWISPVLIMIILLNGFIVNVAYSRMNSELHLKKAIKLKMREDFQNTIQEINKVDATYYTLDPTATPVCWYSGVAYYRLNRYIEAECEFLKAYHYNPYHLRTLNNLATCYVKNNKLDLAVQFYKKTLKISPDFEDALKNLSIVFFKQGKYAESYDYISKCKVDFDDPKYSFLINNLLPVIIDNLITKVNDKMIISILLEIEKSEKWMKDVHIKHIKEKQNIRNQLLLDAIYDLEIIQKLISKEKAEEWRKEYKLEEKISK